MANKNGANDSLIGIIDFNALLQFPLDHGDWSCPKLMELRAQEHCVCKAKHSVYKKNTFFSYLIHTTFCSLPLY